MDDPELDISVESQGKDAASDMPSGEAVHAPRMDVELDEDRYHRLRLIPWWDQERLRRAKVLVIGAGALGNEIVKNLALLGIGRLLICDMDRIENSNLSRAILFRQAHEGREKADVIARAAEEVNPDVRARGWVGNVVHELGLGVFRAFDVVIGGLDNREARLQINQCCWKVNRPWVDGAIEVVSGVARVFVPPDGACYECTMNDTDYELLRRRKSCSLLSRAQMLDGKVPTTPTTSAVIAGIQCQEAIKLLHRDRNLPVLAGKGFYFNGMTHDSFVVEYPRKEECLSHVTYDTVEEMPWRAGELHVGDLVAYARDCLGPEAVVDLEREIVKAFTCRTCNDSTPVFRALGALREGEALCPTCGEVRWPEMLHSLTGNDDIETMTLAELGIPPLDIVTARVGLDCRHLELSGDREAMLGWMDEAR